MRAASGTSTGIHAIIVTYRPDAARLDEVVAALQGTVDAVIVVDNASAQWDPAQWSGGRTALTIKRLEFNAGIAAAQNAGIALARKRNASHVLLLDQDSVPRAGMVDALQAALLQLGQAGTLAACVGTRHRLPDGGPPSSFETYGWLGPRHQACGDADSTVECDSLISSGMLIPIETIDRVGGMDESLFIDLVDTEWCFRAKSKGYRVFGACGAVLDHRLGESTRRIWAGRWRRVPRHQAFRYYYIFRNTLLLARRSYVPLKWFLYYLRWLMALLLLHGVLSTTRSGELRMMLYGAVDGLRGIAGKRYAP